MLRTDNNLFIKQGGIMYGQNRLAVRAEMGNI